MRQTADCLTARRSYSNTKRPWMEKIMRSPIQSSRVVLSLLLFAFSLAAPARAQDKSGEVARKLEGFDAFMEKTLKDWNAPGIGVGVVIEDKLVFAKGYG